MSKEEIQQRIRYLVEHGGLYSDPHDDTLRWVKISVGLVALVFVMLLAHEAWHWMQ